MASVRVRAATGATAVVAVALVAAGCLMLLTLQRNLDAQVGLQAELAGRDVAAQLATGSALADLDTDSSFPIQVVDGNGVVRAVSGGLGEIRGTSAHGVVAEQPEPEPSPSPHALYGDDDGDDDGDGDDDDDDEGGGEGGQLGPGQVDDDVTFRNGTAVVNGERGEYRFAAVEATTPRGEELTVFAGAPLEVEQAALNSVRSSVLIGLPLLLAVVALVTWLVIQRAFRPVEGIRREMDAITRSTDLSRRVPEPASRDEIGRLARTTNQTLAALEASVERQRRFVADASHELRSPIASLRTQLEVGAAHPELLDVPGAVKDTVRLQNLAADLLLLARLDAGERALTEDVALAELVAAELEQRRGDRVRVRVAELTEVAVTGSRGQLARVLGNLLDNAQRHATSLVRVSVRGSADTTDSGATDSGAVVEVADDGAGVPEAERDRVFQRFVRLDDSRSRDDGGAGLGLAIARDVAERHGGRLTVEKAPEGGALFRLRLPLAPRAHAG